MLDTLSVAAKKAQWLQPVVTLVSLASLSEFLYVVLLAEGASKDVYLIPSVVVLIWSLLLYVFLAAFTGVPAIPDKSHNLFFRIKVRIVRWFYYTLAMFICVFTVAVVLLSTRVLNVWRIDF